MIGQPTYCAVSGVVFVPTATSAMEKGYFFCCAGCAAFFRQHEAEVTARRGWRS